MEGNSQTWGRQTYVAARRQKRGELVGRRLAVPERINVLLLPLSILPLPPHPAHLTCPQCDLNICYNASLSKNYTWCAFKAVGRRCVCVWGVGGQANRNGSGQNWLDIQFTAAGAAGAALAMGHHDSARRDADITFRLTKRLGPSSLVRKTQAEEHIRNAGGLERN